MSDSESRILASSMMVRMHPLMEQDIKLRARQYGVTPASWLRSAISQQINKPQLAFPPPVINQFLSEVSAMSRLVARANGSVVQLAKTLRESENPHHQETEAVLEELKATQRKLVDLISEIQNDRRSHKR